MIEVVFNDSIKGSMKVAKSYSKSNIANGAIGYIGEKPSQFEFNNLIENMSQGERVLGDPSDVLSLGFSLDIGKINCSIDSKERKAVYIDLFRLKSENEKDIKMFYKNQVSDYNRLKSAAKSGEVIRAWVSNAPFSACGYSYMCHILRDINCDLRVIYLPSYSQCSESKISSYTSWGEISANELYKYLPLEHKVSVIEKQYHSSIWSDLLAENSSLRAVVNGKLISVPDSFYDHIILKNISENSFVMAHLIGKILGHYKLGISDGWFALRIEKMIKDNVLKVIDEGLGEYNRVLQKV